MKEITTINVASTDRVLRTIDTNIAVNFPKTKIRGLTLYCGVCQRIYKELKWISIEIY